MPESSHASQVRRVRAFNRFYTRRIGVLDEGLLDSPFSLAEARVLFELAAPEPPEAAALARELGLDPGYLSRLLRGLRRRRLVTSSPVPGDRRRRRLALTPSGREAFADLDRRSSQEVGRMLGGLAPAARRRLVEAMGTLEAVLAGPPPPPAALLLRPPHPGDLGWIVERHGALYAAEYGWDERFEGLVAEVVARFAAGHDARRERCWIAERDGERAGSVLLVRRSTEVAQLRVLLVEPAARGLGLGTRLVDECVRFARVAGYRRITLWTNDLLRSARRIYEAAGFRLVAREPHDHFGRGLIGETWELDLGGARVTPPAARPPDPSASPAPPAPGSPPAPSRRAAPPR